MSDPDDLEQVNREISVIAAHIARHRDLITEMRAEGKTTAAAELALKALSELYRQRLEVRHSRQAPSAPHSTPEPAPPPEPEPNDR